MSEIKKTRYSQEELVEFEELIRSKLNKAKQELDYIRKYLAKNEETSEGSTLVNVKTLEAGAATAEKENLSQLALRQQKFIKQLEDALVRIKNGTYGICKESGRLIRKERLRIVPHTRLSIDSKNKQAH